MSEKYTGEKAIQVLLESLVALQMIQTGLIAANMVMNGNMTKEKQTMIQEAIETIADNAKAKVETLG